MGYERKPARTVRILQGPSAISKDTFNMVEYYTKHCFRPETYERLGVREGICSREGTRGEPSLLWSLKQGWKVLYIREPDKGFRWRFAEGGSPEVFGVDTGEGPIHLVEGEWDLMAMLEAGFENVVTAGAAPNLREHHVESFKQRDVVILFDVNDVKRLGEQNLPYGQFHAQRVAKLLDPVATSVKVVELPLKEEGGDVELYLSTHTKDALEAIIEAVEEWKDPIRRVRDIKALLELLYGSKTSGYTAYKKQVIVWEAVLEELQRQGIFYRTPEDERYYFFNETKELSKLDNDPFLSFLHNSMGLNKGTRPYFYVMEGLKAHVYKYGETVEVHRTSHWDDKAKTLYIDDCSSGMFILDGDSIEKADNGYRGVLFEKQKWHEPIVPEESEGGLFEKMLLDSINFASDPEEVKLTLEEQRLLVKVWLLGLFFPSRMKTKALLALIGPKGAGKTTLARRIVQIFYGTGADVRMVSDDRRDFIIMCNSNFLVALDNVDFKLKWLEDELAITSTGASTSFRKLYTTTEETRTNRNIFLVVTARTPKFRREDVSDRLLLMKIEKREEFVGESMILKDTMEARPKIWWELLARLNGIVRRLRETEPKDTSFRLADYASFGEQIFDGNEKDAFLEALKKMAMAQAEFTLEDNPLYQLLDVFVYEECRTGVFTIAELYKELRKMTQDRGLDLPVKNSRALATVFRSLLVSLREKIDIQETRKSGRLKAYRIGPIGSAEFPMEEDECN